MVPTIADAELTYENRLKRYPSWSINEGGLNVTKENEVHKSLKQLALNLDELQIPYVLAGAMALNYHGYQRFTVDIDIIVAKENLEKLHRSLEGKGYLPKFQGSKNLRDIVHKVAIDIIVAGDFPGDGKPKELTFPDPASCYVEIDGVKCLPLEKLIELKLASGMTNTNRIKDIADVQELIKAIHLPREFAQNLHPWVQTKFLEIYPVTFDMED
jgi:hypothetical protein